METISGTMNETVKTLLSWSIASLAIATLTFLIVGFYVDKYQSTKKAAFIAGGASISALALLISYVMIVASIVGENLRLSVTTTPLAFQYSFAFYTVFYAFHCLIPSESKSNKLVVYVGYIWIVVIIAIAIAVLVILVGGKFGYSDPFFGLGLFIKYSIWGFIAVTLLLYFMNKKFLNSKTRSTMLAFIGLHVIAAISRTSVGYSHISNMYLIQGVKFFFVDLPMETAIIMAAYYSSTWIQDNSSNDYNVSQAGSDDLEANPPHGSIKRI